LNKYFAYTRVSTTRQGEGVSLQQQREAIGHFADRSALHILEWLEEQETAATQGRAVFSSMLKRLRKGEATGVIMHKIDRSARNLKDWAELGQLIDQGIEVHFSNESVDLTSRGGRLSADIQAVVAADYIRNLREEVKKGFYGRLKQGYFPMPAPLGYADNGAAKPKTIDPIQGPHIRAAFDLYATGRYSMYTLSEELYREGLRTRRGKQVMRNTINRVLVNPFYIGLIHIKKTDESFVGLHEPLVAKSVFDRVQDVLAGKRTRAGERHAYKYSRLIRCTTCGRSIIGDRKRKRIYYRCHSRKCPTTIIREDLVDKRIIETATSIALTAQETDVLDLEVIHRRSSQTYLLEEERRLLNLRVAANVERQDRLTDAFLDGAIAREEFDRRKTSLLNERIDLDEKLNGIERGISAALAKIEKYVMLVKQASLFTANLHDDELREWMMEALSHSQALPNNVLFEPKKPLADVAKRPDGSYGGACRDRYPSKFWREWMDSIASSVN
jgi:DNA invertase Pin-like site-specific DNA recombinase